MIVASTLLAGSAAWAQESPLYVSARVNFSFGKVETLREGAAAWRFVRAQMTLQPGDMVRMPPVSLLRLDLISADNSDDVEFVVPTGLQEGSVREIIDEAIRIAAKENTRPEPLPGDDPDGGDLPVARGPNRQKSAAPSMTLPDAQLAQWAAYSRADHPLVIELAQQIRARLGESRAPYPPTRLRFLDALHQATRDAIRDYAPVAELFYANDVALEVGLMSFFPSLVEAADIEVRRTTDDDGAPLLLIETGLEPDETALLTANRSLLRVEEDGRTYLRVAADPQYRTLLEAWYQGASDTPSR